jgi:hypothetical protein
MTRLDVEIDPKLDSKFRTTVFKRLGMKRGNLQIAVEDALRTWLRKDDTSTPAHSPKATTKAPELLASTLAS